MTPDNDAIVITAIYYVSNINWMRCRNNIANGYQFYVRCYEKHEYSFNYLFADYVDEQSELIKKIKNIRSELLRMMNDGNNVVQVLSGINLKKIETK